MSELTDAIKAGDAERVAVLVESDPSLLDVAENNVTPILLAVYHGKGEIARQLADRSPSLSFGEAIALGDAEGVKAMLAGDPALLHSRTADGFPSAALAIFFRHSELARYLIEQGADVNAAAENALRVAPLHAAAAVRDREIMQLLLDRGADANAKQQMDYTPLHGAASRGDVDMAKLLLEHGAERDAKGSDGTTPADVARKYGHPAFAEWLESAG
ncbi:MAG TPA: ankyrin repeat domain-containing protein [Thermoanaerobaculia bacterium]|nr:ankyrin repeat domain-containing protein [Thermoanaerobaculia bacterium]